MSTRTFAYKSFLLSTQSENNLQQLPDFLLVSSKYLSCLKSDSRPLKIFFVCFYESSLKMEENAFYFILKALFILKINVCLDFLVKQKKRVDQKYRVYFKIYDVTAWLTNNCNSYIAQYLLKLRQPFNKIWSVNRISQEKYFSSKIMQKKILSKS